MLKEIDIIIGLVRADLLRNFNLKMKEAREPAMEIPNKRTDQKKRILNSMAHVKHEPAVFKEPYGGQRDGSRASQTGEEGRRTGSSGHKIITLKIVDFT